MLNFNISNEFLSQRYIYFNIFFFCEWSLCINTWMRPAYSSLGVHRIFFYIKIKSLCCLCLGIPLFLISEWESDPKKHTKILYTSYLGLGFLYLDTR